MKKTACILILLLLLVSCRTTNNSIRYTIASERADCVGVGPQKCLLVKRGDAGNWTFFYSNIEGFNYEPGYEYVLDVKEEKRESVPADASSIRYILAKEVSRVKKASENLPASVKRNLYNQAIGRVLAIDSEAGSSAGSEKPAEKTVRLLVSGSTISGVNEGDTIYCRLIQSPRVNPVVGREYVFKPKSIHRSRPQGIYLLDTDVLDLVH